ncbi:MAG: hypothetical protein ACI8PW_000992 [Methylophilaceae bacterium]|jgi:hypothetical protein
MLEKAGKSKLGKDNATDKHSKGDEGAKKHEADDKHGSDKKKKCVASWKYASKKGPKF